MKSETQRPSLLYRAAPTEVRREPLSYRVTTRVLQGIPHSVLQSGARAIGLCHYLLATGKRRAYKSNTWGVRRHFRPYRAFQNHALNILEILKVSTESPDSVRDRVNFVGIEHLDAARASGKGVILATYHSGNWEISGLALGLSGRPMTTVAGVQLTHGWSAPLRVLKNRFGIKVVSPGDSPRELCRDLERNRVVALHIDGNIFAGGIDVDFLGTSIRIPRGPAQLSRITGAPICFAYSRRQAGNKLEVRIEPAFAPPTSLNGENEIARTIAERFEKCVLSNPEQWCIFRAMNPRGADR